MTFVQNATGGWRLTWPASFKFPPAVRPTAATSTIIEVEYDGASYLPISSSLVNATAQAIALYNILPS
jgi:hypothetical protein